MLTARLRPAPTLAALSCLLVLLCASCAHAAPANLTERFKACGQGLPAAWQCGEVTVDADHFKARQGRMVLQVMRRRAATRSSRAVLGLAGGPGQGARSLYATFRDMLPADVRDSQDLLLIDTRGTGGSDPVRCRDLQRRGLLGPKAVSRCAGRLHGHASRYATAQTVSDIDQIRSLAGYETLTLIGVSYGTRVATDYARAHPGRVTGLLLDSVIAPGGSDTLGRDELTVVPRVMDSMCDTPLTCSTVTAQPASELAALLHRLPVRTSTYTPNGRKRTITIKPVDLYAVVSAGDFDMSIRLRLPAAVRSAAAGDLAPLAQLAADVTGPTDQGPVDEFSAGTFLAQSCADLHGPWTRTDPLRRRLAAVRAFAAAQPPASFGPFNATAGLQTGLLDACARLNTSGRTISGALPDVPALLLAGTDDLRTSVEQARLMAAQLPSARLLTVPATGHSVLTSTEAGCVKTAVKLLFAGTPQQAADCPAAGADSDRVQTPVSPARLTDIPGTADEQAAEAVRLTVRAFADRQNQHTALTGPQPPFSGLRGGSARDGRGGYRLTGFSFITAVTVSGTLNVDGELPRGTLTVRLPGRTVRARVTAGRVTVGAAISERIDAEQQALEAQAEAETA